MCHRGQGHLRFAVGEYVLGIINVIYNPSCGKEEYANIQPMIEIFYSNQKQKVDLRVVLWEGDRRCTIFHGAMFGWLWFRRKTSHPPIDGLHVKVFLGRMLNSNLLLMTVPWGASVHSKTITLDEPLNVSLTHHCINVRMNWLMLVL